MATSRAESIVDADWGINTDERRVLRHVVYAGQRHNFYCSYLKPAIDRILGVLLLAVAAPAIAVTASLVALKIGRPVIYKQDRIGKHGEPFRLYKFRTMKADRRKAQKDFPGPDRRQRHKTPTDPRVLPFGDTLRRLRLDELPQLWNVVKGDMSLVGPRPEMVEIVEEYAEWQHLRHVVKPGLTGVWQISEQNGKLMHEYTHIDLEYVARITLWRDIAIILKTPFAMLGSRQGY